MMDDPYAQSDTGSFEKKCGFKFIVTLFTYIVDGHALLTLYVEQKDEHRLFLITLVLYMKIYTCVIITLFFYFISIIIVCFVVLI